MKMVVAHIYSFARVVAAVAGIVVLGSCVGCRRDGEPPPTRHLKVGYIPIVECAHLYVGIAKNFFDEKGIEVELIPMAGGSLILPALQRGDLDVGFTNVVSLVSVNSKLDRRDPKGFVSLAGASYERESHVNHALLVKQGSPLLQGTLGTGDLKISLNTTRNIEELMLRRFLDLKGIPQERLKIVTMAFSDMLPALERGDVDVVSAVEPFIQPALRTGKYDRLDNQYLAVSPNTVVATYAVTRRWSQEHRELAEEFEEVFGKADEFVKNNGAEARQIIASFTRIRLEDMTVIGLPAFEQKIDKKSIAELSREMVRHKFIGSEPDLDDIVDWRSGR